MLLTGASGGVGPYIARAVARAGANVVLTGRNEGRLSAIAKECERLGAKASCIVADIAEAAERVRLVEAVGRVDVLVNNAAFEIPVRLLDLSDVEVQRQIEVNLVAPIDLTRRLLPGMLERRQGVIVNVSSMSARTPSPCQTIYAATKSGLNGFTASLRYELEGTGVHAGVVCPSFVGKAGMWVNGGARAPRLVREVEPEQVAAAVLKTIGGAAEVLVAPGPVRLLLAMQELLPGLEHRVLRAMGVFQAVEDRAAKYRSRNP